MMNMAYNYMTGQDDGQPVVMGGANGYAAQPYNLGNVDFNAPALNLPNNYAAGISGNAPIQTTGNQPAGYAGDVFADWAAQQGNNANIAGGMGSTIYNSMPNSSTAPALTQAGNPIGDASGGFFDNFLSSEGQQGWGGLAIGGAGALANSWLGLQNLGVAKDSLNFQRDAFNRQFDAQRGDIAQYREDRQAARDAAFA